MRNGPVWFRMASMLMTSSFMGQRPLQYGFPPKVLRFGMEKQAPSMTTPAPKAPSAANPAPAQGKWRRWLAPLFWLTVAVGVLPTMGRHLWQQDPIQMVQQVHRNTRRCPQGIQDKLQPYFNLSPYRVDFDDLQVIPEFSPGFKNRNHVIPGFGGSVVLNPQHYQAYLQFDKLPAEEQRELTIIFAHELTHLIQIQMLGRDEFLGRIASESLAHKDVYDTTSELFQRIQAQKEAQNKVNDPEMFVHPELTLEQSAVLMELFVSHRI